MKKKEAAAAAANGKNIKDFIYMVACGIKNVTPEESRIEDMNLTEVMHLAMQHMMGAMVAQAFVRTETFKKMPEERQEKWETICYGAVRRQVFFRKESARVFKALDDAGIWYCPIKGISTADCYLIPGIREMADCDLLVDENRPEDVKNVMESLGYTSELYGESNHDVYHKPPRYNFEMHRQLFNLEVIPVFDRYYENVKDRLIKDEGNEYGFHFSHEDEYIFNVAHTFKHFRNGGTGMRSFTDVYAIRHKYTDMDVAYLKAEFEKLELTDFERMLRGTAEALFGQADNIYKAELSKEQKEMVIYILGSGAYGTSENTMHNTLMRLGNEDKISFKTRIRYILDRIYPKGFRYEKKYAFFYRHKWAYSFLPIYRLFVRGSVKSAVREVKRTMKTK